jgi:hypothetical protein
MFRLLAVVGVLIALDVITAPVATAQGCYTERASTCALTPKCSFHMISRGCSRGVRTCCPVNLGGTPQVTTGGGTIGGGYIGCYIGGVLRRDIVQGDCHEAQTTGCIRRLLTAAQYTNCLRAQRPPIKTTRRPKA